MTKDHTGIHADSYEEGVAPICIHGGLRRQCEACDLADRLEAAEARIAALEREVARLKGNRSEPAWDVAMLVVGIMLAGALIVWASR